MADQTLTPEVRIILDESSFSNEGTLLKLPGQLSPETYKKVDLILGMLDGKWNKSKGGHVFKRDARHTLEACMKSGLVPDLKKRRQAYYTPAAVAALLMDEAYLENVEALEPSAGDGALAREARARGANVTCIEADAYEVEVLRADGFPTTHGDFLQIEPNPKYDCVIMNPPFTKGQDEKHVDHALKFLAPNGKLLAIVSPSFKIKKLREYAKTFGMNRVGFNRIEAGSFKESGTGIETRMLTIRGYGGRTVDNRDKIEWRGHQLAVEAIHGSAGMNLNRTLSKDKPRGEKFKTLIERTVEKVCQEKYRSPQAELNDTIVDDDLLAEILKVAQIECFNYFRNGYDYEDDYETETKQTPENPVVADLSNFEEIEKELEEGLVASKNNCAKAGHLAKSITRPKQTQLDLF